MERMDRHRSRSPTSLRSSMKSSPTRPYQTLTHQNHSVLSLAATSKYIFSGSQGSCIHVWDRITFLPVKILKGHKDGVFALRVANEKGWLISGSGDGTVRVWDLHSFECLLVAKVVSNSGDVLSLAWSVEKGVVYIGCQDTSIQWFDVVEAINSSESKLYSASGDGAFFSSHEAQKHRKKLSIVDKHWYCVNAQTQVIPHAHFGYVYALLAEMIQEIGAECLISGGGDGVVKIWKLHDAGRPELLRKLEVNDSGCIYALCTREGILMAGTQEGDIKVWELEGFDLIRSIHAHEEDVLTIVPSPEGSSHGFFTGSADGLIKRWDRNFDCIQKLDDHEGIVLCATTVASRFLVTGGSDNRIKLYKIVYMPTSSHVESFLPSAPDDHDAMLSALSQWIEFPSVSGLHKQRPQNVEECRRSAKFIKNLFRHLGAESRLVYNEVEINPLVIARFSTRQGRSLKTYPHRPFHVLIYGHYDVVPVDESQWRFEPFRVSGESGYLYGRGISDDKGPIIAMAYAVYDVFAEKEALDLQVTFLIEGEEENGSLGFPQMVMDNLDYIGEVDVVLSSNSYWLGEEIPCLTYGLRGNIRANIEVTSPVKRDLHSGVDGGSSEEPMQILVSLLASMANPQRKILIPGFNDRVRPVTDTESKLYDELTSDEFSVDKEKLKEYLMRKWRFPSLTVHRVESSTSSSSETGAVIPFKATARITMRTVPNQQAKEIVEAFEKHVIHTFEAFHSECSIEVTVDRIADWWLGDITNPSFTIMAEAIEQEWGRKPLYIREGGSIPAMRWLEKTFKTAAINLPMGQASDAAHLSNERIRLRNLFGGRNVVRTFLEQLMKFKDKQSSAN